MCIYVACLSVHTTYIGVSVSICAGVGSVSRVSVCVREGGRGGRGFVSSGMNPPSSRPSLQPSPPPQTAWVLIFLKSY